MLVVENCVSNFFLNKLMGGFLMMNSRFLDQNWKFNCIYEIIIVKKISYF